MDDPSLTEDLRRALRAARYENVRSVEEARPLVRELLDQLRDEYDFDNDPQAGQRLLDDSRRVAEEKLAEQERRELEA